MSRAVPELGPRVSRSPYCLWLQATWQLQRTLSTWPGSPAGGAPWSWTSHGQWDPTVDGHWDFSALRPFVYTKGKLRISLIGNLYFPEVVTPNLHCSVLTAHRQVGWACRSRGLEKEYVLSSLLWKDTQRPEGSPSNVPFGARASGLLPAPISAQAVGSLGVPGAYSPRFRGSEQQLPDSPNKLLGCLILPGHLFWPPRPTAGAGTCSEKG